MGNKTDCFYSSQNLSCGNLQTQKVLRQRLFFGRIQTKNIIQTRQENDIFNTVSKIGTVDDIEPLVGKNNALTRDIKDRLSDNKLLSFLRSRIS